MQSIQRVLTEKYSPVGMIVYGSYASGTNEAQSDFDALLIVKSGDCSHDTSRINGVQMDVFVYSEEAIRLLEDMDAVLQIYGGRILLDKEGLAAQLLKKVEAYIAAISHSSLESKMELRAWCLKMLSRSERGDFEGLYRGHWLLVDSLSVYCALRDMFYFGPKKTIAYLQREDPDGYILFCDALKEQNRLPLWINYVLQPTGV